MVRPFSRGLLAPTNGSLSHSFTRSLISACKITDFLPPPQSPFIGKNATPIFRAMSGLCQGYDHPMQSPIIFFDSSLVCPLIIIALFFFFVRAPSKFTLWGERRPRGPHQLAQWGARPMSPVDLASRYRPFATWSRTRWLPCLAPSLRSSFPR